MLANKVELEDEDDLDDNDEEVEVTGILSFDMVSGSWSVNDIVLEFSQNTEYDPESLAESISDGSADGLTVEVEGKHVNGVLQVEEVELEEDELEFKATVSAVTSNGPKDGIVTLSFGSATGTIDVIVDNSTMFLDDNADQQFDLSSIMIGKKLEIEARWADGSIVASALHIEDDVETEIKGPVGAIDDVSITVLEVTFTVDATTVFVDGMPAVDDYVEIADADSDGIADFVEIDD